MSTDGWMWAVQRRHLLKSPLEMLIALRIGDVGGLDEGQWDRWTSRFDKLADFCRSTPYEVAAALQAVADATGCELTISGEEFTFRVPEFTESMRQSRARDPRVLMRQQFDVMRPRLIEEGILQEPCRACGAPAEHIDHIIPIERGGTNDRDNLQPLCSLCNLSKGKKTMDEFMAWRASKTELSFAEYVASVHAGDNPRGDLIRDVRREIKIGAFPDVKSLDEFESHLVLRRACAGAIEAGLQLWKEYQRKHVPPSADGGGHA